MKLSIITINLNNAIGLQKTIESVISQSFSDYEYLIIDGGSTDRSVSVIKDHSEKISYWVSEHDKGIYNAMNKGIIKAQGEYCLFLNSGDFLYSDDTIEKVFLLSEGSDIIYGDVLLTQKYPPKEWIQKHPANLSFISFYPGGICHQATFIKRVLFNDYGLYNESYQIVSDWEFFLKTIILSNVSYKHMDVIISVYNRDGFGNQNPEKGIAEMQQVLEEKFPPLVLKDLELYKSNYSDIQFLISIKKSKLTYFVFKLFKRITRLYINYGTP